MSNPALRKSITFDNDTAFAQHALLRTMRAMTTWFCDAYASWQKGGVENANGRLRRWLPRQIDIDKVSDEEIQDIVITANLTPRKCLGFKTPFQAILKSLAKTCKSGSYSSVALGSRIQALFLGVPFLRPPFQPALKLLGNVAQRVPAHRVELPVGVEEADDALRLLERLNQPVHQDAIKAPVMPSNAVPVVFVEGVHERHPADPSSAG